MQRKQLIFLLKWAVKDGLLNQLLQCWIKEKEKEIVNKNKFNTKENQPNISNPYQACTKDAPKKRLKSTLEDTSMAKSHKSKGWEFATK